MHGAITQAPMSREQLETSSLRTIYTTKKKTKPHSESYHLKVDKELQKFLWPFFIISLHLALLTVAIASSEYYFDLYSQRRICLRIKTYVIGQLS